ncbi:hypothetical protein CEXT_61901 [Caerostris extrusa]|uniref:Uncharacterized protein n=1 Tax=Caerostris extrusa TaxID=172846 RepID=A0AAV4MTS0_CAEEX|nr:hypothetical protein CEXT_61901 [Caerostris extrusa]
MNPFRRMGRNSILFNSAICRKLDGFSVCVFSSFLPLHKTPSGLSTPHATHSIFVATMHVLHLLHNTPPLPCWKIMNKV